MGCEMKDYNRATKRDRPDDIDDRKHVKITKKAIDDIIVGLNNIAAKYGYGKGTEPFTNDEWNTIFRAKGIIKHLTAENQRLKEEAAEQKSIAEHEHATQMEWFRIACDYKAENAELRARLEKAVELPCKVGDTVYFIPASISKTSEFFIMEWKIESIIIMEKSYTLNCVDSKKRFYYMFDRLFGIQWFTDRTKAEARLKELQGGER